MIGHHGEYSLLACRKWSAPARANRTPPNGVLCQLDSSKDSLLACREAE